MNRLRTLRAEKHLSMRDLADKVGINYATISNLETGKRDFTLDHLERLSKFFDCDFEYIQGTSDKRRNIVTKVIIPSENDVETAFFNQNGIVTEEQKKMLKKFIVMLTEDSKNDA